MTKKRKNTWAKALQARQDYTKYAFLPDTNNPILCQMYLIMYKAIEFASNLYHDTLFIASLGALHTAAQRCKSETGDDFLHQMLEFESDELDGKMDTREDLLESFNNSPKYTPSALRLAMRLVINEQKTNSYFANSELQGYLGEQFLGMASKFFVIPYSTCNYSRIADDAVDYLVSLGTPSDELWESFAEYLEMMAGEAHNGNFEEVMTFNINGQANAIYYGYRHNYAYKFHYSIEDVSVQCMMRTEFHKSHVKDDAVATYKDDGSTNPEKLNIDDWSFLINLWAAKQHKDFVVGNELQTNFPTIAESVNAICKHPNWSTYSYVHISDAGRSAYEEAKRIISQARGNAEYKKTMWYTRAYYARRGKNGVIVLNKASIHHRKCATPLDTPHVTVYT